MYAPTKDNILRFLREHKEELRRRFGVRRIGLFGSVARGEENASSDIDIIVDMPSSFENYFDLKYYLQEAFGKEVDLAKTSTLRPLIYDAVKNEICYV